MWCAACTAADLQSERNGQSKCGSGGTSNIGKTLCQAWAVANGKFFNNSCSEGLNYPGWYQCAHARIHKRVNACKRACMRKHTGVPSVHKGAGTRFWETRWFTTLGRSVQTAKPASTVLPTMGPPLCAVLPARQIKRQAVTAR